MERMTQKTENGYEIRNDVSLNDAVERLAAFENMYEVLLIEAERAEKKIDQLREQDKTKTVAFRQLFGEKLKLSEMINRVGFWIK